MRIEWTSYQSPVGVLTILEAREGPLIVEFAERTGRLVRQQLVIANDDRQAFGTGERGHAIRPAGHDEAIVHRLPRA